MFGTIILFLIIGLLFLWVIFSFTPQPSENKKESTEITNWEYQREQAKRESKAEKNKEWFSEKRWLTDKEIDWATERLVNNDKFKILPAYQFHYVKEADRREAGAYLAFPNLLSELQSNPDPFDKGLEINDGSKELVFIPVNNPDFHWSLLVYQVKNQKFYHYDTLRGANYEYVQPLVTELLQQIQPTNQPNLAEYLIKRHDIRQGNGSDCGVAVIAIIKRIMALAAKQSWIDKLKYGTFQLGDDLGKFDFPEERKELRIKYLTTNE